MNSFNELKLSPEMMRAIGDMGFQTPSPIQAETLPILLRSSTDFLGLAATGTGKTAAFGIPLLEKIQPRKRSVQALILCPTRELVVQTAGQLSLLGKYKGVSVLPIYGGAGYQEQMQGLRSGAAIVVGTPGRLIDHIDRGTLDLSELDIIVLDEADEMISMGFKEDLTAILSKAPLETCSTWLFSATMSSEVRKVADEYLCDPEQVQVNRTEMLSGTVEQFFYVTQESNKPEVLCKLIDVADENVYGLIFCQTKSLVIDLTRYLNDRGYKVDCLHGDMDQKARERTMQGFRDHKVKLLVCTDVASRGLDVKDITHVFNFSIPRELDNYVHRIGRTGRSGKAGIAMSLVTPSNRGLVVKIERMTKSKMKEGKIPSRKEIAAKKVVQVLNTFKAQEAFPRAIELMGPEWKEAIAAMTPEEIAGRFLAMSFPEVFATREQAEAVREIKMPSLIDSRGGDRQRAPRERSGGYSRDRAPTGVQIQVPQKRVEKRSEVSAEISMEGIKAEIKGGFGGDRRKKFGNGGGFKKPFRGGGKFGKKKPGGNSAWAK